MQSKQNGYQIDSFPHCRQQEQTGVKREISRPIRPVQGKDRRGHDSRTPIRTNSSKEGDARLLRAVEGKDGRRRDCRTPIRADRHGERNLKADSTSLREEEAVHKQKEL